MEPNQTSSPAVPIAIICGFAMIAIAIFFTNQNTSQSATNTQDQSGDQVASTGVPRPVDSSDYILGNPNAPILLIEYSDYDCPFCKQFHNTMHQIMDEYGITGRVAWVYRQFPLAQLHPNSPRISEAALCVGEIGGNDAFWTFTDLIYDERQPDEPTNTTKLPEYAQVAGVSLSEYQACMQSGRMQTAVEDSLRDGFNVGARGTPYTVIMVGSQQAVISGAQPYETVKGIVQNLIDQLEGDFDPATQIESELPTTNSGVPLLE